MIDQIVRSKRRTLALQITPEARLIVRAPHRASMDEILRMVNNHLAWIRKHQTRLRSEKEERPLLTEDERAQLENRTRAEALTMIPARAAALAQTAGLSYSSLRISDARTRWGSCSRQGRLNFSWRLAL